MNYRDLADIYGDIQSRLKAIGSYPDLKTSKAYAYNAILLQAQRMAGQAERVSIRLMALVPGERDGMAYPHGRMLRAMIMANHNTNELDVAFESICAVRDMLETEYMALDGFLNTQIENRRAA
jgi:hypothetical protein